MVRQVMLGALLALAVLPHLAYAEVGEPDSVSTTSPDYTAQLDSISTGISNLSADNQQTKTELERHLVAIETLLAPEPEQEEKTEEKSEDTKLLESINDQISEITLSGREQTEEQVPLGATRDTQTFVAYANANPTNQYAQYSMGMLPKLSYSDGYVFLQDTSSSYVFIWGTVEQTNSTTLRGNGKWVRWYYSNQSVGYLTEYGSGDYSVSTNSHVVLSNVGDWPMLNASDEIARRDVGFYALVAVCIFCFAHVLRFCIRLHGDVSM